MWCFHYLYVMLSEYSDRVWLFEVLFSSMIIWVIIWVIIQLNDYLSYLYETLFEMIIWCIIYMRRFRNIPIVCDYLSYYSAQWLFEWLFELLFSSMIIWVIYMRHYSRWLFDEYLIIWDLRSRIRSCFFNCGKRNWICRGRSSQSVSQSAASQPVIRWYKP